MTMAIAFNDSELADAIPVVPVVEAFFFGEAEQQIFATYHAPSRGAGRVLTVVCPPLFADYSRTHLALRKLSIALAESGQHVLRFDYRGTGDSFGDLADVAPSDWIDDIAAAVTEARELSACSVVQLLGVRASALLACRAATTKADVERVTLWDPVSDGADYLEKRRRTQRLRLDKNYYLARSDRLAAESEYAGYRLTERMVGELRALDSSVYRAARAKIAHVVSSEPERATPVADVPVVAAPFACRWETDTEDLLVPGPLLEKLISCLTTV